MRRTVAAGAVVAAMAAGLVGVTPSTAEARPTFGHGCVKIPEFNQVVDLGRGTGQHKVEHIFGAKGVPGDDLFGYHGRIHVYFACPQKRWNHRYGKGPKYWVVVAKYKHRDIVQLKATNRGLRP